MLVLDAVQTLALAGIALFLGYALCRVIPVFGRYNLPPPVIGGLLFALAAFAPAAVWLFLAFALAFRLKPAHITPGTRLAAPYRMGTTMARPAPMQA